MGVRHTLAQHGQQRVVRADRRYAGDVRQVVLVGPSGAGQKRVGDHREHDRPATGALQRRLQRRRRQRHQEIGAVAERGVDERVERRHVALGVAHRDDEITVGDEAGVDETGADPVLRVLDLGDVDVLQDVDAPAFRERRARAGRSRRCRLCGCRARRGADELRALAHLVRQPPRIAQVGERLLVHDEPLRDDVRDRHRRRVGAMEDLRRQRARNTANLVVVRAEVEERAARRVPRNAGEDWDVRAPRHGDDRVDCREDHDVARHPERARPPGDE